MNQKIIGLASLAFFVILTMYGLYSAEAESTRQISYISEVQKNPEKFRDKEIALLGELKEENGSLVLEDKTGNIAVVGDRITSKMTLVYGKYFNGKIIASTIHEVPYTKFLFILLGGVLVAIHLVLYYIPDFNKFMLRERVKKSA